MKVLSYLTDFKRRSFITIVALGVISLLLIFCYREKMFFLLALVVALLIGVAMYEYGLLVRKKDAKISLALLTIGGVALLIGLFYLGDPLAALFLLMVASFLHSFSAIEGAFTRVAIYFLGFFFIALPLALLLPILYLAPDGRFWIVFLLATTKGGDIFAYLGGSLFGKHLLAKKLSPRKTIEGLVFALVVVLGGVFLFYHLEMTPFPSLTEALVLGALFVIGGQMGDVCESLLKRDVAVKDSSIIPGMGGILDMVDSLLLNSFLLYFYRVGG